MSEFQILSFNFSVGQLFKKGFMRNIYELILSRDFTRKTFLLGSYARKEKDY